MPEKAWGDGAVDVSHADDADLPGDRFVATDDGRVVNLEREAARRRTNDVHNTVRDGHPDREAVPTHRAASSGDGLPEDTLPPGREDRGGHVDVEDQRY